MLVHPSVGFSSASFKNQQGDTSRPESQGEKVSAKSGLSEPINFAEPINSAAVIAQILKQDLKSNDLIDPSIPSIEVEQKQSSKGKPSWPETISKLTFGKK